MIFNEFADRFLQGNSTEEGFDSMKVNILKAKKKVLHTKLVPVTIVNNREHETDPIEYLIKIAPSDYGLRKRKPYDKMYHREWFVYTDCLPEFENHEKQKGIATNLRFRAYPICYAVSLKPFEETLILENLEGKRNFRLWNKKYPMDELHIKLVLKEYAKFHAVSFAVKKFRPALINYIEKNTKDIFMELLQKTQELDNVEILCARLIKTDEMVDKPDGVKKMIFLKENIVKMMIEIVEIKANKSVLLHGGSCYNDVMFRYEDPITKILPTEVKFIDWQKARFGSQVLDVASFLYTSLNSQGLAQLDEFLKFYHEKFLEHGDRLKFDLTNEYTFEEFLADWSNFSVFGLGVSILVLYKIFMGKDYSLRKLCKDEENSNEEFLFSTEYIENEKCYLRRVLDVFRHFVERGFI